MLSTAKIVSSFGELELGLGLRVDFRVLINSPLTHLNRNRQ